AEAALARGDLAEAVKQMSALPPPAHEAAAGWLADAKARLVTDAALAELDRAALALLRQPETRSPRSGPGPERPSARRHRVRRLGRAGGPGVAARGIAGRGGPRLARLAHRYVGELARGGPRGGPRRRGHALRDLERHPHPAAPPRPGARAAAEG